MTTDGSVVSPSQARSILAARVARSLALLRWTGWRPWHYLVLLLANFPVLASGAKAGGKDWQVIAYPWAEVLRYSVLRYGQFPWWNPWSVGGQPLMADPQIAVFMPDSLILLGFGAVAGYKILLILYQLAAYEGCRRLCRHFFGESPFVVAVSVIPAIIPALGLHFDVGHVVFLAFYLFPWLLYFALAWPRGDRAAVGLGVVIGMFLLSYIHYTIIIAFTILVIVAGVTAVLNIRSRAIWPRAGLVVCTALGLGLFRIGLTYAIVRNFPRTDTAHYPIVASVIDVIRTLVEPFQNRDTRGGIADLGWWELGSYVGFFVILLAYEGLRRRPRRFWPLHVAPLLCLILAWNNRDPFFPSTWLHTIPPWSSMIVITRWRLFACFFLLLGAVQGLVALHRDGRRVLASLLAVVIVGDVGFHYAYALRNTFDQPAPPLVRGTDPPPSAFSWDAGTAWRDIRANRVALQSESSLLGWFIRSPHRLHIGVPNYAGDFALSKDLTLDEWTPNRIRMHGPPGAQVQINVNPSSYWRLNGRQLFPSYRQFEPDLDFRFRVPANGQIELTPRPAFLGLLLAQLAFAAAAVAIYFRRGKLAR